MSVGWVCGGWGGGGEAGLQMSQVPTRTEDAVYKSQWPIQNNAGGRYTEEIFKEVSHQAIVFSENLDIGWPMYHHSGTVNLRILAWIFFYQYSSIFEQKKQGWI